MFVPSFADASERVVDRWSADRRLEIVGARRLYEFAELAAEMPFQLVGSGSLPWFVQRARSVEVHRFQVE